MKLELRLEKEKCSSRDVGSTKAINEVNLLREYRRLQIKLGRPPTSKDMAEFGCYSVATYIRRYGSWTKFRKMMNNPVETNKVSKVALINNYYEVKRKLGKVPTGKELGEHGEYGVRTYHKYFGGHKKFLKMLGESG